MLLRCIYILWCDIYCIICFVVVCGMCDACVLWCVFVRCAVRCAVVWYGIIWYSMLLCGVVCRGVDGILPVLYCTMCGGML